MPTFEYIQHFVPTPIKNYICIFSTAPHLPEYEITTTNLTFGLYSGFSINWDAELSYDHVFIWLPSKWDPLQASHHISVPVLKHQRELWFIDAAV